MIRFYRSFRHAVSGILYTLRHERNFQIELSVAVVVLGAMYFFPLDSKERAILLILIAIVLMMELVNTAFERMLDMLKPQVHPYVKVIKDIVAGVVLIASFLALLAGAVIFWPYVVLFSV